MCLLERIYEKGVPSVKSDWSKRKIEYTKVAAVYREREFFLSKDNKLFNMCRYCSIQNVFLYIFLLFRILWKSRTFFFTLTRWLIATEGIFIFAYVSDIFLKLQDIRRTATCFCRSLRYRKYMCKVSWNFMFVVADSFSSDSRSLRFP